MENMTTREKADHIWYYYKLHIIGGLLAIIMISSFVSSILNRKEFVLNVTMLGKGIASEKLVDVQKSVTSSMLGNPGNKEVQLDFIYYDKNSNDQLTMASLQKFTAMVATGSIDVLLLDKADFEGFAEKGMFVKLDDIGGLSGVKAPGYETVQARGEDGSQHPYGISADNLQILKDVGYNTQNKIVCVLSNSKNRDMSLEFIKWMFKLK